MLIIVEIAKIIVYIEITAIAVIVKFIEGFSPSKRSKVGYGVP